MRRFEIRFEAYTNLSAHLERVRMWAERSEPVLGPKPAPPDMPTDDEVNALNGAVQLALSAGARDANMAVNKALSRFQYHVEEYRAVGQLGRSWDDNDPRSPRQKLDEAREEAFEVIARAQAVMNGELADL
jgi:hypothetical protein